ncbi:hypothetical protein BU15DRAFT_66967 [Melanogaster broomeanus]|nr:hypothetical protein BU15DRAFT_66967 [Melanogaster broomeanus]
MRSRLQRLAASMILPSDDVTNPFDFMDVISLQGKTNFFEKRVSDYSKANVNVSNSKTETTASKTFACEANGAGEEVNDDAWNPVQPTGANAGTREGRGTADQNANGVSLAVPSSQGNNAWNPVQPASANAGTREGRGAADQNANGHEHTRGRGATDQNANGISLAAPSSQGNNAWNPVQPAGANAGTREGRGAVDENSNGVSLAVTVASREKNSPKTQVDTRQPRNKPKSPYPPKLALHKQTAHPPSHYTTTNFLSQEGPVSKERGPDDNKAPQSTSLPSMPTKTKKPVVASQSSTSSPDPLGTDHRHWGVSQTHSRQHRSRRRDDRGTMKPHWRNMQDTPVNYQIGTSHRRSASTS